MIETLPKGALVDTPDQRDYVANELMGKAQVDFSKEFRLPVPPDSDQAQADCCVGEAWSYYHWQLRNKTFSVRSIFAYIAQNYGAYIRDGGLRVVKFGQETSVEAPDPNPKTPSNMRSKDGLTPANALDDREFDSKIVPESLFIDGLALGISEYRGCVFGVTGSNEGWQNLENPRPPGNNEQTWGHALYAMGYHLHNGIKCIIAKSSWCNTGVKEHHIKEDYFASGNIFNAWTLIPRKGNIMYQKVVKQDGKTFGVRAATPNGDQIIYATGEEQWRSWSKTDSYQLDTVNPDGSSNFSGCTVLPW